MQQVGRTLQLMGRWAAAGFLQDAWTCAMAPFCKPSPPQRC